MSGRRGFAKLSGGRGNHARRNGRVANGINDSVQWTPGEQQALIQKALAENRITKCDSADVTNKPVFGFDDSSFEGGKI